jgi:hypothetical protein
VSVLASIQALALAIFSSIFAPEISIGLLVTRLGGMSDAVQVCVGSLFIDFNFVADAVAVADTVANADAVADAVSGLCAVQHCRFTQYVPAFDRSCFHH